MNVFVDVVRRYGHRWTETLAFADDFLRTHLSGPVSNIWKELCVSVTRTALGLGWLVIGWCTLH
jgi:hypothetical protein